MMRLQMPDLKKLEALRSQTDRELIALMNNRLQRGFSAAGRMEYGSQAWCDEVARVCAEVGRLLPVVERMSKAERDRIEARLSELEGMISCCAMRAAS